MVSSTSVFLVAEVAETVGEHLSLWAIRLALLAMFAAFALQLRGVSEVSNLVRSVWLCGAICAFLHSVGSLFTFHAGSHQEAFESTAKQTEELLGVAFGIGLYVNYVFVAVWFGDAALRWIRRDFYRSLPVWYRAVVYGFLGFIAVNGTIVFKAGWIRLVALAAIAALGFLWWKRFAKRI